MTTPLVDDLTSISKSTLAAVSHVAREASEQLGLLRASGADSFTTVNTWNDNAPAKNLFNIGDKKRLDLARLAETPALFRIVALVDGVVGTFIVVPATPHGVTATDGKLVPYGSPLGRIAVLEVGEGEELELPTGDKTILVIEKTRFIAREDRDGWDGIDAVIEQQDNTPKSIMSLRGLLLRPSVTAIETDALEAVVAAEAALQNVIEGIRRVTIERMSLRDLPALDRYQDEIHRLPLSRRLLIVGPPGTGKTTTLVKRLGQKLDPSMLLAEELQVLARSGLAIGDHMDSWSMFTPTDLLRLYLKEAFSRERVPASDLRLSTWQATRNDLARNRYKILKSSAAGGAFGLRVELKSLKSATLRLQSEWFDDFNRHQREDFATELRKAAGVLVAAKEPDAVSIGRKLANIVAATEGGLSVQDLLSIGSLESEVQAALSARRDDTDDRIKRRANTLVNTNSDFLQSFAAFLDTLSVEEPIDAEDEMDEEDDVEPAARTKPAAALQAYVVNMRSQAKYRNAGRPVPKTSRAGRIAEWLGDRRIDDQAMVSVGSSLAVQDALRKFVGVFRKQLAGTPARYRRFRRARQIDGLWYNPDGFNHADIHPLEVDVVLLAILRFASEAIQNRTVRRSLDDAGYAELQSFASLLRNQVMVDEAMDFSPVQLACMFALAHPDLKSFFASGDFNQRITDWGSATPEEVAWAIPGVEVRPVTIAYRQTEELRDLAVAITALNGQAQPTPSLPKHMVDNGFRPALGLGLSDHQASARWIASRIVEIEFHTRPSPIPSVAVLVHGESQVGPLAKALAEALIDENLNVVACYDGRYTGVGNDIAVFDVQHIKGLEFEAAFFVSVDQLGKLHPDLFEKFLYVGCTRAATFLGVTCEDTSMPDQLSSLVDFFGESWT